MSAIDVKYSELGGQGGFLGRPVTNERPCPDKKGRYRHYQGGSIYWHPDTGAHEVHGAIRSKWSRMGWEKSFLGYPMWDETPRLDRVGRWQKFQGGYIHWHPDTGAREVHGAIMVRYHHQKSRFGYPISDELDTPDGGRYSRFQKGFVVWTPESGAHGIGDGWADPAVDIEKVQPEFYKRMKEWHGIDLKRNLDVKTNKKKYTGWQFVSFWNDNKLNRRRLSRRERLVLTVGRILLMQWHLRDLRNHDGLRRSQIDKYFKRNHAFKQRQSLKKNLKWKWHYNKWCSEFASYLYKSAGTPVYLRKRQAFFAKNIGRWEKIGWCVSKYSYFTDIFRKAGKYVKMRSVTKHYGSEGTYLPQIGDYLRGGHHSMVILGSKYEQVASAPRRLQLYIVEGNGGSGGPEGKNREVRVRYKNATDSDLRGVGRMDVLTTYDY